MITMVGHTFMISLISVHPCWQVLIEQCQRPTRQDKDKEEKFQVQFLDFPLIFVINYQIIPLIISLILCSEQNDNQTISNQLNHYITFICRIKEFVCLSIYNQILKTMDYNINIEDQKDAYSPHTDYNNVNNTNYQRKEEINETQGSKDSPQKQNMDHSGSPEQPTGCTKFCRLEFYEQFFRVSQLDVVTRIKQSFMPWKTGFIENLDNNPDLYGPFWLITTLIFLLSSTGNFARYFANFFTKSDYLFNLALVQQGVIVMYSFGFGFPTALYFIMKLLGCNRLRLPEVICLYGYSFSCFVIIFLLCIIPVKALQWIFIAYGMVNTTVFLIFNLKVYLDDVENAKKYLTFGIIAVAQLALFLIFKLVFFDTSLNLTEPPTSD